MYRREDGDAEDFFRPVLTKKVLALDVKVCISDVNIGKNEVYNSLYAGIPSKKVYVQIGRASCRERV